MGWIITEDRITAEGEESYAVGRQNADADIPSLDAVKGKGWTTFRLYDDDGEHYYTGRIDDAGLDAEDGAPGSLYEALQWGAYWAGCTDLRLRSVDAVRKGQLSQAYVDEYHPKGGWLGIYG